MPKFRRNIQTPSSGLNVGIYRRVCTAPGLRTTSLDILVKIVSSIKVTISMEQIISEADVPQMVKNILGLL
jgi:hypothetical protein